MQLSSTASRVPGSGIREIVNLAMARPAGSVVRLEIGEPDVLTPPHVVAAAVEAASRQAHYTHSSGLIELREHIVGHLNQTYALGTDTDRVVVSQGAVQALAVIFSAVLSPGDEVLVADPAWPNYEMQAILLGATVRRYATPAENAFMPDVREIERLITDRTKILVLNSPSNPTGAVMDAATVQSIVELAASRGILVVSDEVYDEIVFDGTHISAMPYAPESVASVFSFSKTYSMTGWRVGYAALPGWLAETVGRLQEPFLSSVSEVTQRAAIAAISGPQQSLAVNRELYRSRRDLVVNRLRAAGIDVQSPGGAFYLMMPLGEGVDSRAAAVDLVAHGVSTAPGTAFGTEASSMLRLSLASSPEALTEGVDRILAWHAATDAGRSVGLLAAR